MPEMTWFNITVIFIASAAVACTFMLLWQLVNFKTWALQRDLQKDAELKRLATQLDAVHPILTGTDHEEIIGGLQGSLAELKDRVDSLSLHTDSSWHTVDESQAALEILALQKSVKELQESHHRVKEASTQIFLLETQVEAMQRGVESDGNLRELKELVERQETDIRGVRMKTRELSRSLRDLYKWADEIDECLDEGGQDDGVQLLNPEGFKVRRLR